MPKTKSERERVQQRIFVDNPVWVGFYKKDPTAGSQDPESSNVNPIAWDEGSRIEFPDWDVSNPNTAYNETEVLLTNNTGGEVRIAYIVLWDAQSGGNSTYWKEVENPPRILDGNTILIREADIALRL
ncbi:MAG: hypothetical protein BRC33_01585 [Cyanobacteria bacterium SW_9_44_58]|nr:MAG: hypothetical protein BRC33_01585 [Cyanobacteria bacterium SW_9_44_58]